MKPADLKRPARNGLPLTVLTRRAGGFDAIKESYLVDLQVALQHESPQMIKELVQKLSTPAWLELLHSKSNNGNTALHQAVAANVNMVKILLDDVPPDQRHELLMCRNNSNATPLHLAVDQKNAMVVGYMINIFQNTSETSSAKLELLLAKDGTGISVVQKACLQNDIVCLQVMLQSLTESEQLQLIHPWCSDGQTLVHHAVQQNNSLVIKHLFQNICEEHRVDILLSKSFNGLTPLHLAARQKQLDLMVILLEAVVDPWSRYELLTVRNFEGLAPLQIIFDWEEEKLTMKAITGLGHCLTGIDIRSLLNDMNILSKYPFAMQYFQISHKKLERLLIEERFAELDDAQWPKAVHSPERAAEDRERMLEVEIIMTMERNKYIANMLSSIGDELDQEELLAPALRRAVESADKVKPILNKMRTPWTSTTRKKFAIGDMLAQLTLRTTLDVIAKASVIPLIYLLFMHFHPRKISEVPLRLLRIISGST